MRSLWSSVVLIDLVAYNDEVESKIPNFTQHCWYLDNSIIAGTETEINEASDILTVSGKTCGLELKRDKFEFWSKGALSG